MSMPRTESTDMKVWEELEWRITPLNVPVLVVETPDAFMDLRSVEPQGVLPGDIDFIQVSRRRSIDILTHQSLLKESLQEYSNIWRTLAGR